MVSFDVVAGRFPDENDWEGVVLNQVVPGVDRQKVGDTVVLSIAGRDQELRIVGLVEEVGTGAAAYVSRKTFLESVPPKHRATSIRVARETTVELNTLMQEVNRFLDERHAPVSALLPLSVFKNAVAAHFEILVGSLLALSGLAGFVGFMGLFSALSANVTEGTREFAVLRAVGATGKQIRSLVIREALLVCTLSFCLSIVFGLVLSERIGTIIGMMSFRLPLPLAPQWLAFPGLLLALIGAGMVASLVPARRASALTVARGLRVL
jgi:putative ABC transport system permease protein